MKKYIFDTSIFSLDGIQKLNESKLLEAIRQNKIAIYLTPILIEERFDFLHQPRKRWNEMGIQVSKAIMALPFEKIFRDINGKEGVLALELQRQLHKYSVFLSKDDFEYTIQGLNLSLQSKSFGSKEFRIKKQEWKNRKIIRKKAYADLRIEFQKELSEDNLDNKTSDFNEFCKSRFIETGVELIQRQGVDQALEANLIKNWKVNQKYLVYSKSYVRGRLFALYHCLTKNKSIDKGCHEDLDHLIYLNRVDGIVSQEEGFMKDAAHQLFPQKEYLSLDSFISEISNMVS